MFGKTTTSSKKKYKQDEDDVSCINMQSNFTLHTERDGKEVALRIPFFISVKCANMGTLKAMRHAKKKTEEFNKHITTLEAEKFCDLIDRIVTGERFNVIPGVEMNYSGAYWIHQLNHFVKSGLVDNETKERAISDNKFSREFPAKDELKFLEDADLK